MPPVAVRPATPADRAAWEALFAGYAAFYEVAQSTDGVERVWGWLHDEAHPLRCLLAVDGADRPVGLAHVRPYPRALEADVACFLDDLFVDPAARGSGAADALLVAIGDLAAEQGWTQTSWITAADNARAQAVYARHAARADWVTYEMG